MENWRIDTPTDLETLLTTADRPLSRSSQRSARQLGRDRVLLPLSLALAAAFPLARAQSVVAEKAPDGAAVAATAAAAKDATPEAASTVVIQANRRREPLRQVPLRVDVLQADALERQGATSMVD